MMDDFDLHPNNPRTSDRLIFEGGEHATFDPQALPNVV